VYSKNLKNLFFKKPNELELSLKHLLIGVNQVCSNKSPWFKIGPAVGQGGALYTGERL
jgi:hypothetical protein